MQIWLVLNKKNCEVTWMVIMGTGTGVMVNPCLPIIAFHITTLFFLWKLTKFVFIVNKLIILNFFLCNQSLKWAHKYAFYKPKQCVNPYSV